MRWSLLLAVLVGCVAVVVSPSLQTQPDSKKTAPTAVQSEDQKKGVDTDRSDDEKAIRASVDAFVKAYNAHDAKAIAALFTENAQVVDQDGNASEGRDEIEKVFKDLFTATPQKQIEVTVNSIRFIGPNVALEQGTTKETLAGNETPEYDRYKVLHVKRDGKWMMALAEDSDEDAATPHEQLQPLAWLVGEWVDDGGSSVVNSSCRWSEDKNFLLQEFNVRINGENAMRVNQRIGWDPVTKRIRSWVFDSEGGFGESVWARDGDGWIIKATGVRQDGKTASATNVLIPAGKDGYVLRSRDRVVGDEVSSPTEFKVVRKPPQPKQ
jgi:uncharacterized protein (TIGR02246 family)